MEGAGAGQDAGRTHPTGVCCSAIEPTGPADAPSVARSAMIRTPKKPATAATRATRTATITRFRSGVSAAVSGSGARVADSDCAQGGGGNASTGPAILALAGRGNGTEPDDCGWMLGRGPACGS